MTNTLNMPQTGLDADALRTLARQQGPCLTIQVPDHHPGAPEGSRCAVLRGLVKRAAEDLAGGRLARSAAELVAPLEELGRDPRLETGGPGLAIFRAPGFLAQFFVRGVVEQVTLASHFHLTTFLADAFAPHEMLVLALSTKRLRLFSYAGGECREIELPAGVPESLEAAGQFDRSDPQLSNRKFVGVSAGDLRGAHFGTTADREAAAKYLHDFFEAVDRGLKPALSGRPLLLLGVKEEIAAFQRAAGVGNTLLTSEPGNADCLTESEIAERAHTAARAEYYRRGEVVLAEYLEMKERRRTSADIRAVLRAAAQGRVHRLCVRESTPVFGEMPRELGRAFLPEEDLIAAAVAETLRNGGEVFAVGRENLPSTAPIAAILRY